METDKDTFTLTYLNEDDRAYGLAGMAISLAALDAIDRVISVSLDAKGPMVKFTGGYFFSSSPSVSPKAVWNNMVHNFYITSAMVVSNVMARSMVRRETDVPAVVLNGEPLPQDHGRDASHLRQPAPAAAHRGVRAHAVAPPHAVGQRDL